MDKCFPGNRIGGDWGSVIGDLGEGIGSWVAAIWSVTVLGLLLIDRILWIKGGLAGFSIWTLPSMNRECLVIGLEIR